MEVMGFACHGFSDKACHRFCDYGQWNIWVFSGCDNGSNGFLLVTEFVTMKPMGFYLSQVS